MVSLLQVFYHLFEFILLSNLISGASDLWTSRFTTKVPRASLRHPIDHRAFPRKSSVQTVSEAGARFCSWRIYQIEASGFVYNWNAYLNLDECSSSSSASNICKDNGDGTYVCTCGQKGCADEPFLCPMPYGRYSYCLYLEKHAAYPIHLGGNLHPLWNLRLACLHRSSQLTTFICNLQNMTPTRSIYRLPPNDFLI